MMLGKFDEKLKSFYLVEHKFNKSNMVDGTYSTEFVLGKRSYTGGETYVRYWGMVDKSQSIVYVGNSSSIANNVHFFCDGNHRYDQACTYPFYENSFTSDPKNKNHWGKGAPVVGNDVWIAEGSRIMSGVKIGDGAVVCAYSVVTKDVPPYAIVAGNPAVIKRFRFSQEIIDRFLAVQWWDLPEEIFLKEILPYQYDPELFLQRAEHFRSIQNIQNIQNQQH
jgi:acetyltransferase-like isoleucine patch superfamily enzyme